MKKKWIDVTEYFTEEQRHYRGTYLEIDEVYDEKLEVSLFTSQEGLNEIYVSYGIMSGIIYVEADDIESKREVIKKELEDEYQIHKQPTDEFIDMFCKKHIISFDF